VTDDFAALHQCLPVVFIPARLTKTLVDHIHEKRPLRFSPVSSDIFKIDGAFAAAKPNAQRRLFDHSHDTL
jgi:hypothetical protein